MFYHLRRLAAVLVSVGILGAGASASRGPRQVSHTPPALHASGDVFRYTLFQVPKAQVRRRSSKGLTAIYGSPISA